MEFVSSKVIKVTLRTITILFWLITHPVPDMLWADIGEVIFSFPAPASKPTGLTWDGQYLWNADTGTQRIYKIDPSNGSVIYSIPSPSNSIINGLAWDGQFLWCTDNAQDRLYKIDVRDSSIVDTIAVPTTLPRGLTFDGQYLWYQDSGARVIHKLDPVTGVVLYTLISPKGYNRGLTWDGKYLWSSDRNANEIYMIDPVRGSVVLILSAPGTYSYGLAWDGTFLWNADYGTHRIYKIQAYGSDKYTVENPLDVKIRYSVRIKNVGSTNMNLETFLAVPFESVHQALIDSIKFVSTPQKFFTDSWGQEIAYYKETLTPAQEKLYQWEVNTTTYDVRYFLFPDSVGVEEEIPDSIQTKYTVDGKKYKITHPVITQAVTEALAGETDYYWKVRKIHDYVIAHIKYVNDSRWDDAPTVLTQGHGSCSEYSFVFIAMCRAAGIPAQYEVGGHLRASLPYEDTVFHRWQQVYFPNYGWVPIDCTWDDKEYPANQARYFGAYSNKAFATTIGGGGEYGLWWTYNSANTNSGGKRDRKKVMAWLPPTTDVEIQVESTPLPQIAMAQNYPNPFNAETVIRYTLPRASHVTVDIFNTLGQVIVCLVDSEEPAGVHEIWWDGNNHLGQPVASGVYFYAIQTRDQNIIQPMLLLR